MANTTGKKYGGREQGTPNRLTKDIKETYRMLIEDNLPKIETWINEVAENNPAKALEFILKLSEFVLPKMKATDLKTDFGNAIITVKPPDFTPEEREIKINELKKKLFDEN